MKRAVYAMTILMLLFVSARAEETYDYTVQDNQTSGHILRDINISLDDLRRVNPGKDLSRLRVGELINIPFSQAVHAIAADNERMKERAQASAKDLARAYEKITELEAERDDVQKVLLRVETDARAKARYVRLFLVSLFGFVGAMSLFFYTGRRWFDVRIIAAHQERELTGLRDVESKLRMQNAADINRLQRIFAVPQEKMEECLALAHILESLPPSVAKDELQATLAKLAELRSPLRVLPGHASKR